MNKYEKVWESDRKSSSGPSGPSFVNIVLVCFCLFVHVFGCFWRLEKVRERRLEKVRGEGGRLEQVGGRGRLERVRGGEVWGSVRKSTSEARRGSARKQWQVAKSARGAGPPRSITLAPPTVETTPGECSGLCPRASGSLGERVLQPAAPSWPPAHGHAVQIFLFVQTFLGDFNLQKLPFRRL